MVNDFWLKNKHTISIFQAQVRDLAKNIEAQPKKHNAYKKKRVSSLFEKKDFIQSKDCPKKYFSHKVDYYLCTETELVIFNMFLSATAL